MQVDISFRHMEPSETLRQYADEKVCHVIRKHIRDDFDAQVTLSVEKIRHIAKFILNYKGIQIKCEESSDDMYQSIDLALDKLERQIRRYKGKLRQHKPGKVSLQHVDLTVLALAESEEEDFGEDENAVDETSVTPNILKREQISVEAMDVDDALMHLNLENRPFLVFVNKETDHINVLYTREDGTFGLIDPAR